MTDGYGPSLAAFRISLRAVDLDAAEMVLEAECEKPLNPGEAWLLNTITGELLPVDKA